MKGYKYWLVIAAIMQTVWSAGSYVTPNYDLDYDAAPPKITDPSTTLNSVTKFCFNSGIELDDISPFGSMENGSMMISAEFGFMGSDTTIYVSPAINDPVIDITQLAADPAAMLTIAPGFPVLGAAGDSSSGGSNIVARPLLYDVYPGTANILEPVNTYIAFKAFTNYSAPNYNAIDPRGLVVNLLLNNGDSGSIQFKLDSTATAFEGGNVKSGWTGTIISGLENGQSMGFRFDPPSTQLAVGTKVQVGIFANNNITNSQDKITFNFLVEGIPFLAKIVSENTETGNYSGSPLNSVLYGWSVAGNGDINGDGFSDLVIGDPYYKYSNTSNDGVRSGRVYVYYGGLDKIIDARMAPDLILENLVTDNSWSTKATTDQQNACREFGFNVKVGDVNGDSFADVIVGHPSYGKNSTSQEINKGRLLVYFGGPKLKDGRSLLNHLRPSMIIFNDNDFGGGDPDASDLLGEKFDVGDINNDGYADIVAKAGERIKIISGAKIYEKLPNQFLQSVEPIGISQIVKDVGMLCDRKSQVSIVGDFNGDGFNDFVVGWPKDYSGYDTSRMSAVVMYLGRDNIDYFTLNTGLDVKMLDRSIDSRFFGYSISAADINADGKSDLIVGKRTTMGETGKVLIFMGKSDLSSGEYNYDPSRQSPGVIAITDPMPTIGPIVSGNVTSNMAQFGLAVAGIGDADNDGYGDFAIGAPFYGESGFGAAYVFLGGNFVDNVVGLDNLRNYVITGKVPNQHFGMKLAGIGDFDGNGYSNLLISGPGFSGGSDFNGYKLEEGILPTDLHIVDIYANAKGVDSKLPILMKTISSPANGTAGWDARNTINFVLADRGKSGLEFNAFQIQLFKNGMENGTYVLASKQSHGAAAIFKDFTLTDFWAAENNLQIKDDLGGNLSGWSSSEFGTLTGASADGYTIYNYQKNAKFIGISLVPNNINLLKDADDYYFLLKIKDRGGDPFGEFAGPEREYSVTLNFSTLQERYTDIGTANFEAKPTGPDQGQFTSVGDYDGDGINDFAYANPEANGGKGEVYLYWGSSAINFGIEPDLILRLSPTSPFSKLGKFLTHVNIDSDDTQDIVIGHKNGVYVLVDGDSQDLRIIPRGRILYVESMSSKELRCRGDGFPAQNNTLYNVQVVKNKLGKKEAVVLYYYLDDVAGAKYYLDARYEETNIVSNKFEVTDTVGAMTAGYFENKNEQTLAVGYPDWISDKVGAGAGMVKVYSDIRAANFGTTNQMKNDSLPGAHLGYALAAGYFDKLLDATGFPVTSGAPANLAIGLPFADAYGEDAGLVIVLKGATVPPDVGAVASSNAYVLKPESSFDRFGWSLSSAKYFSSPEHYQLWGGDVSNKYFDDADELIVGAPGFHSDYGLSDFATAQGKVYIYKGGSPFATEPSAGYFTVNASRLGYSLGVVGDILNVNNELIAMGHGGPKVLALINNTIPDTIAPHLDLVVPADHEYEVPQNTPLIIEASDVSGISDQELFIRRKYNGQLIDIVANGKVIDTHLTNGGKYFLPLAISSLTGDGRSKRYTLTPSPNSLWNESEVAEFEVRLGDGRIVWSSRNGRPVRQYAPLITTFNYGFVAKYKPNAAGQGYEFHGQDVSNTYFGESLAYVGDVNKDGLADFVVGEQGNTEKGFFSGKAYLYLGNPDINKFTKPAAQFSVGFGTDSQTSARFGWKVAPAGDMNGDGYDDVVIVAANSTLTGSEALILFGNPDPRTGIDEMTRVRVDDAPASYPWNEIYMSQYATCIKAAQAGDAAGFGIFGGGDLNGDGYSDLVIGAPKFDDSGKTDVGRAYVIFGRQNMVGANSRYVAGDYGAVANAGPIRLSEINTDLTSGARSNADNLVAGYIPSPVSETNARFGQAVLSNVNINGDSVIITTNISPVVTKNSVLSDVLISATGASSGAGKVFIYSRAGDSNAWSLQKKHELTGDSSGDEFGYSLAALGDISADTNLGLDMSKLIGTDFVVGAPGQRGTDVKNSKYDLGSIYVYMAKPANTGDFTVQRIMQAYGQNAGDRFGYVVSNVGNVDNDVYGNNDIAVGAPYYDVIKEASVNISTEIANLSTTSQNVFFDYLNNANRNAYKYIYDSGVLTVRGIMSGDDRDSIATINPTLVAPMANLYAKALSGVISNAGRVYIFGTNISNIGDDLAPNYQLNLSSYPQFVAQGNAANQFFGASIAYLGDLDDDFVPEYLVGAPGYSSPDIYTAGNLGKVFLYTNNDNIPPSVYDPMSYIRPIPGELGADLVGYVDHPVSLNIKIPQYNKPIKFRINDDRAVEVGSVMAEVNAVLSDHTETRRYTFLPPVAGEREFTLVNRKTVDYFLNLKDKIYYETTYNIKIYATDRKNNALSYTAITPEDMFGTKRVPDYMLIPNHLTARYFQFSFVTTVNQAAGPAIELSLKDAITNSYDYYGTNAYLSLTLKDNKEVTPGAYSISVSPNGIVTSTVVVMDVTQNIYDTRKSVPVFSGALVGLTDFPNGQRDGRFELTVKALDSDNNLTTKTQTFIRDLDAPTINAVYPLAGSNGNPDDCSINILAKDFGTGIKVFGANPGVVDYANFQITITTQNTQVLTSADYKVSYNSALAPEGFADYLPEVYFTISGLKFAYEQFVTISITLKDNALHPTTYVYSYQVSPDYRPPFIRAGEVPIIWESPYTTGNMTISVNAYDDVGVAAVEFTVSELIGDISGNSGLATDALTLEGPRVVSINTVNALINNLGENNYFNGLFSLYLCKAPGMTLVDGARVITVRYLDAQGNKSKPVSTSIALNVSSRDGGPIMPLLLVSPVGSATPPLFDDMTRYINTKNVDLWVYAADLVVSPAVGVSDNVPITNTVLGYVLGVEGYAVKADPSVAANSRLDRLRKFDDPENQVFDPRTRRTFVRIPDVDISGAGEGAINLLVNFVDNDAGLQMDRDMGDGTTLSAKIFTNDQISPRNPYGVDSFKEPSIDSAGHPINNIASVTNNYALYVPTWNAVHFSDNPFIITLNFDLTRPIVDKLVARAGSTQGGAAALYKSTMFSRDYKHLQFSMDYSDAWVTSNIRIDYPVADLYYQIIAVSGNTHLLLVDAAGEDQFTFSNGSINRDWYRTADYRAYNGTQVAKSKFIYLTPGDGDQTADYNGFVTDNVLTVKVDQVGGQSGSVTVDAGNFAIDTINATYFEETNPQNWTHLDLRPDDMLTHLDIEIPVNLVSGNGGYYFRVVVRDRAGNYSKILTSNLVNVDETKPANPKYNYKQNVKLSRDKFDLDFSDADSGLYAVQFKLGLDSTYSFYSPDYDLAQAYPPDLVYSVTVNNQKVEYFSTLRQTNWVIPQTVWDNLPNGSATSLFFRLQDGVNLEYNTAQGDEFKFIKDTVPLTVSNNAFDESTTIILLGKTYTNQDSATFNFELGEKHLVVLTDMTSTTVNADDLGLLKDFSFEYAGDKEIADSAYLMMTNTADVLVTTSIKFLESNPSVNGVTGKHFNGNYALATDFAISALSGVTYNWQGLSVTVDTSMFVDTVNIGVGVLIDTSLINVDEKGNAGYYPIGSDPNAGGFALVLEDEKYPGLHNEISSARINYMKSLGNPAEGQDWTLITANILIEPGTPWVTVNVRLLKNLSTSLNIQDFVFDRTNHLLGGRMLVDGLVIVPGIQPPYILSTVNSSEYSLPLQVNQGLNTFMFVGYDDVQNVVTKAIEITRDNTAPTWNGGYVIVTNSALTPTGNTPYVAYYYLASTKLLTGADHRFTDSRPVGMMQNSEGQLFTNSFDYYGATDPRNVAYLSAYFLAYDPDAPVQLYNARVYDENNVLLPGSAVTLNAQNKDIDTPLRPLVFDNKLDIGKGKPYTIAVRAINNMGYASDPITLDPIIIDVDAPTVSYEVGQSLIVSINETTTKDSGWYLDDIPVTVHARDIMWITNVSWNYGGVGVRKIFYKINNGATQEVDVAAMPSVNVFVTFNLTAEGPNNFEVWAEDYFGYSSAHLKKLWDLNIDRTIPNALFTGISSIISDPQLGTTQLKWQRQNIGFDLKFADVGAGTRELHWFIDDIEQPLYELDLFPVGQRATFNYVPRGTTQDVDIKIKEGVVNGSFAQTKLVGFSGLSKLLDNGIIYEANTNYRWNADQQAPLFLNDEELGMALDKIGITGDAKEYLVNIYRHETVDKQIYYQPLSSQRMTFDTDGYHKVALYTIDKLGHQSPTVDTQYVCIDRGRPDVVLSIGTAQSAWSLEPINISLETFDMFRDPVLVTSSFYTGADYLKIPDALKDLEVRRPGSGVKEITLTINNTRKIVLSDATAIYRAGFTAGVSGLYDKSDTGLILDDNGVNMLTFQAIDFAGNASELTYWDGTPEKKHWYDAVGTYVYDGDNGVIRGIKVDTKPPYEQFMNIATASITDLLPVNGLYPLYTNKQDILVYFGAKDDGIGVRYVYITATENAIGTANGIVNTAMPDPDNFLYVDQWQDISKLTGAPERASNEQGITNYYNYRKIRLGDNPGVRTVMVQFADDFGLDYIVTKSSLEDQSVTFDATQPVTTANYVPLDKYNSGEYSVSIDGSTGFFYWGGLFDVPQVVKDAMSYTIKPVLYGSTTFNVYVWNVTELGNPNGEHIAATINANLFSNPTKLQFIYDNFVTKSIFEPTINEMIADDTVSTGMLINANQVTLRYFHDETDELSGIAYVQFGGNISAIKTEGSATIYAPGDWVPYGYRAGVTNDYTITIVPPAEDSVISINITGIKDRSNNIVTGNVHPISFYYDRPMPWDKLDQRIVIRDANNPSYVLKGNGRSVVLNNATTLLTELNMFGAGSYEVSEYFKQSTINILATGNYSDLPAYPGMPGEKALTVALSVPNQDDGRKIIYVKMIDRGTGPSSSYTVTYDYTVDTTKPTINITSLDLNKFYAYQVTFDVVVDDSNLASSYVSGLQRVDYWINNVHFAKDFSTQLINATTINAVINTSGLNNTIVVTATDKMGNSSTVTVNGIKLNALPPQIMDQYSLAAGQGTVVGTDIYTRTVTPSVSFQTVGAQFMNLGGDLTGPYQINPFNSNTYYVLPLSDGDGTKNITLWAQDNYTANGGPSANKTISLFLDRNKPLITMGTVVSGSINYLPDDLFITGTRMDVQDNGYASGADTYVYLNTDLSTKRQTESLDASNWRASLRSLVEASGRKQGVFTLRFFAQDKAGNMNGDGYQVVTFNLTQKYVKGGTQSNINSLAVTDLTQDDNRLKIADGKLTGVKANSGLDASITEFTARDASGNVISNIQTVSGDVKLVLQYPEAAAKGTDPDTFKIYYLNETTAEWELVPGTQVVDKTNRTVEVKITHFSIYRIFSTVAYASDLKKVMVYPNPYIGNDDDLSNGEDDSAQYGKVVVENITNTAKVRIYTVSGELVNTKEIQGSNTQIAWDLDNMNGQAVASGIYVILVTDQDNNKHIGRVTVVR